MAGSERLGDCDVLFELASGGMATILLARQLGDAGFERLVALKRVHRHLVQDPEVFAMASDEARLAALVRHANVVAVTGVLDAGGELVLVQEYVEGFGLGRVLRELARRGEKLSPSIAARSLIDAAKGLHATHEARDLLGQPLEIVHRDVSPQNLLIGTDGTTRLIDFGIARAERRMAATRTGILKGKLSYMAPEQIGEAPVDRRADVLAAGAAALPAPARGGGGGEARAGRPSGAREGAGRAVLQRRRAGEGHRRRHSPCGRGAGDRARRGAVRGRARTPAGANRRCDRAHPSASWRRGGGGLGIERARDTARARRRAAAPRPEARLTPLGRARWPRRGRGPRVGDRDDAKPSS